MSRARTIRRGGATLLLALAALWCATAPRANEIYGLADAELDFYRGNDLLKQWRVGEARELVDGMLARDGDDEAARSLDAHVKFFEGRYEASLATLEALGARGGFRDLVRVTAESTANFSSRSSEHFEVFWDNPKDEILADPALEALEAAHAALQAELGFAPEGRVRVEIYPTVAAFTGVSTLTREEVRTSGTIGLCKFNRIMITSPRATFWGYRWRDTLCHEYVHLALFHLSRGKAPIWVHEGIAKHYEGAWRDRIGRLSPTSLALLSYRYGEGTLIPLEKMSPSVAKLPSAEDTSTAFAQVGTMMRFLKEERGEDALKRLAGHIADGLDDRAALEAVWGAGFADFEARWTEWVAGLPQQEKSVEIVGVALREDRNAEPEPGEIRDPFARDYARLGDMLRARGRMKAAAVEYGKAYVLSPMTPAIASRHALGRLVLEEYGEALLALEGVLALYEDRGVLWSRKGEALLGLERYAEASDAFTELMEINPFDLPGRNGLMHALRKLGDEAGAQRQREMLELIQGDGTNETTHP